MEEQTQKTLQEILSAISMLSDRIERIENTLRKLDALDAKLDKVDFKIDAIAKELLPGPQLRALGIKPPPTSGSSLGNSPEPPPLGAKPR